MDDRTRRYFERLLLGLALSSREHICEEEAFEFYDMCKEYFDWYKTVDPKAKLDHRYMHRILWSYGIRTKNDLKNASEDYIATIKGLRSRGKKFALIMVMKLSLE